jgi:hypothetical protein
MKWYVETYHPTDCVEAKYRVHRGEGFNPDYLSPHCTSVIEVDGAATMHEAVALALEAAAGTIHAVRGIK